MKSSICLLYFFTCSVWPTAKFLHDILSILTMIYDVSCFVYVQCVTTHVSSIVCVKSVILYLITVQLPSKKKPSLKSTKVVSTKPVTQDVKMIANQSGGETKAP